MFYPSSTGDPCLMIFMRCVLYGHQDLMKRLSHFQKNGEKNISAIFLTSGNAEDQRPEIHPFYLIKIEKINIAGKRLRQKFFRSYTQGLSDSEKIGDGEIYFTGFHF